MARFTLPSAAITAVCLCYLYDAGIAFGEPPPAKNAHLENGEVEFLPHGGFAISTLRSQRWQQILTQEHIMSPAPSIRGPGKYLIPVVCIKFPDTDLPGPDPSTHSDYSAQGFQNELFDTASPPTHRKTLTKYFWDMSNGNVWISGTVLDWFTLSHGHQYYENGSHGGGAPFGELLKEAFTHADSILDFSKYDSNNDGVVDAMVVIHSEGGAESGISGWESNIQSRMAHYSDPEFGHPGPFETRAIWKDKNGQPKMKDGKPQHIVIDDFTIQPAVSEVDDSSPKTPTPIGIFCHETGHILGLPDLYNRNQSARDFGTGAYCVMSYGSYGGNGRSHCETPVSLSAWCKYFLKWANVVPITKSGTVNFESVERMNKIYKIDIGKDGREFLLVEYRNTKWLDPFNQTINWDVDLPKTGLAIWHVDETVGDPSSNIDWPLAQLNAGENDCPSLPNDRNTGYDPNGHALVALLQADHRMDLENGVNACDDTDFWLGSDTFGDDPKFFAGSRRYDGTATGISIHNIDFQNETFQVDMPTQLSPQPPGPLAQTDSLVPGGGSAPPPLNGAPSVVPEASPLGNMPTGTATDTIIISAASSPTNQSETEVKRLIANGAAEDRVPIRYDENRLPSRIDNLAIPVRPPSFSGASSGLTSQISKLSSVDLVSNPFGTSALDHTFNQVVKVDSEPLPIAGATVEAYPTEAKPNVISTITGSLTPPAALQITGKPGQLSLAEAKQLIVDKLNIPSSAVKDQTQVVYKVNNDPSKAVVAVQVTVSGGTHQPDINIFIDQSTRKVLSIQ